MFDLLISFFNTVLYQPLFNALILLYEYLPGHDFGIAVIALTLIIRLLLYPSSVQAIKSQAALSRLQPKIKEIQQKYKDEKEKQAMEMMELYKKEKINPLSGCLPLLIQLPLIIALYQVFWKGFKSEEMHFLYSFVPYSGTIDTTFLGMLSLSEPSAVLAVLAGIAQFFQSKMMVTAPTSKKKGNDIAQTMQKQMTYFLPFFTVFILWNMPSAVGLYWLVTSLFSIIQQYFILKPQAQPIQGSQG
ncbi:membrane protein insertase YidC [Candidatus Parcubacteria bacterium]|nr:membrane protein insertase YidC [Candidatus Parcubacteria bacterium]